MGLRVASGIFREIPEIFRELKFSEITEILKSLKIINNEITEIFNIQLKFSNRETFPEIQITNLYTLIN